MDQWNETNRHLWLHLFQKGQKLYLRNASREDSGLFTCVATNSEGTSEAEYNLTVFGMLSVLQIMTTVIYLTQCFPKNVGP